MLSLGCGQQDGGEELRWGQLQQSIADGESDATTKAVVAVLRPADRKLCTGTLIAPNVVLTAGHCVSPAINAENGVVCDQTALGPSVSAGGISVATTATVKSGVPGEYVVQEVVRPPGDNDLYCGNDVALVILEDVVDESQVTPISPRLTEPLSANRRSLPRRLQVRCLPGARSMHQHLAARAAPRP